MGGFSQDELALTIDHIFKTAAYTQHTNLYLALAKSTIDDGDNGTTIPTELSGSGYARIVCNTWDAASAGTPANRSTENTQTESFAQATGNQGTATDFAVVTHSSTGKIVCFGKLDTAKKITTNDTASFATGAIDIKITGTA